MRVRNEHGRLLVVAIAFSLLITSSAHTQKTVSLVAPGAKVKKLAGGFRFTEGPAADARGNIYFTDIPASRIHRWSVSGTVSVFLENSGGANGLFFDRDGNLLACAGRGRCVVSVDPEGKVTTLVSRWEGKRLNSPNDLWLHPQGGIYFTDPRYGKRDGMEMREYVFHLSADRKKLTRVIDDLVRPNGLIGTPDGKKLYVADPGDRKTYVYTVNTDGTLSGRKLFAPEGSDGMTMDIAGNVYLTTRCVAVYDPAGKKIEKIDVPERPSNVCFGGRDGRTLFITARKSLYSVSMRVRGVRNMMGD